MVRVVAVRAIVTEQLKKELVEELQGMADETQRRIDQMLQTDHCTAIADEDNGFQSRSGKHRIGNLDACSKCCGTPVRGMHCVQRLE